MTPGRFRPLDLAGHRNAPRRGEPLPFPDGQRRPLERLPAGSQRFRGIPFQLGEADGDGRWILLDAEVTIPVGAAATHVVVVHACAPAADEPPAAPEPDFMAHAGQPLARYTLVYADGDEQHQVIRRRFEVNEWWSTLPPVSFASVDHSGHRSADWRGPHPAQLPPVFGPAGSSSMLALPGSWAVNQSGIQDDHAVDAPWYWLYALPVRRPEQALAALRLAPWQPARGAGRAPEAVLVAGVTLFQGSASPLAYRRSELLRITAPGAALDAGVPVEVDLGVVGARQAEPAAGDPGRWLEPGFWGWGDAADPPPGTGAVLAEVSSSPDATLTVGGTPVALGPALAHGAATSTDGSVRVEVVARGRRVRVRVVDAATGRPTPARVHFHGPDGRYLPPAGHRAEVNPGLMEDYGADLRLGTTSYAYVDGAFDIELPPGVVCCEIVKGFEYRPLRARVELPGNGPELTFALERAADLRRDGWVTADTHVHFVPPSTALLEAQAEGLNLVHVLATQWGRLYTNVGDFLASPLLDHAAEAGVWVGSEHRQPLLGHMSLLNPGTALFPFATGGAPTSPLGDPVSTLMATWADRCRERGGLVVSPHFPFPYGEIAADIVEGKLDAIEIFGFAAMPDGPRIRDWYRFLNCGYRVPAVGGTDKMSAGTPVGAVRTYAQLRPDAPFGFESWADAVRAGRTFVTSGPLLSLSVDGQGPGGAVRLPRGGGSVTVEAAARSVGRLGTLEVVVNGQVVASTSAGASAGQGAAELRLRERVTVPGTAWVATRCTTPDVIRMAFPTAVAAHTSPVYVRCGDTELLRRADAEVLLTLIDGGLEWLRSLAVVESEADRGRYAEFFETARARLAGRMAAVPPG